VRTDITRDRSLILHIPRRREILLRVATKMTVITNAVSRNPCCFQFKENIALFRDGRMHIEANWRFLKVGTSGPPLATTAGRETQRQEQRQEHRQLI
jgi:hypothetical protein